MAELIIEKERLEKRLKHLDWDELKLLLWKMEESEDYEICVLIQREIDLRVNNYRE